jgi:very-short-patch-repair endonuclease
LTHSTDNGGTAVALRFYRARLLRRNETDAERKLWQQLRAKRFSALKFRRQFPIGDFIVDFCCKELRLVIELDGGQHAEPAAVASDSRRTGWLKSRGYRVLRFWNNDVLTNIDGVAQAILDAVRETSP